MQFTLGKYKTCNGEQAYVTEISTLTQSDKDGLYSETKLNVGDQFLAGYVEHKHFVTEWHLDGTNLDEYSDWDLVE